MSQISAKLPVALQGAEAQNQVILHEIPKEMELLDAKRTFWGRATHIEDKALRVIAKIAVVMAYIFTGFALYAIDQSRKATYTEGYLLAQKNHKFEYSVGSVARSTGIKILGVAGRLLCVGALRKFAPSVFNGVGNYLQGVRASTSYRGIPAMFARSVQRLGFRAAISGTQGLTPLVCGANIAVGVGFEVIQKEALTPILPWWLGLLKHNPLETSMQSLTATSLFTDTAGFILAAGKFCKGEISRRKPLTTEGLTAVKEMFVAQNEQTTLMGRARSINNSTRRFFAIVKVVFLYIATFGILALYDKAEKVTDEQVQKYIKEIRSEKTMNALSPVGEKALNLTILAGMTLALGVNPVTAVAALFTWKILPQIVFPIAFEQLGKLKSDLYAEIKRDAMSPEQIKLAELKQQFATLPVNPELRKHLNGDIQKIEKALKKGDDVTEALEKLGGQIQRISAQVQAQQRVAIEEHLKEQVLALA